MTELPDLLISNRETPIARNTLHMLMKKYGEEAEIPSEKRNFHVLKHPIAVHMLEGRADIVDVKDWLGHQNTMESARITKLGVRTGTRGW